MSAPAIPKPGTESGPASPGGRDTRSPSAAPTAQPNPEDVPSAAANGESTAELVAEGTDLEADDDYDSAFGGASE